MGLMHKHNVSVSLCKLHPINSLRYCIRQIFKIERQKGKICIRGMYPVPAPAHARDIRWFCKVMKRYFFARSTENGYSSTSIPLPVILICSKTFSKKSIPRHLTRGAPTTCRDTGSLLTSLMLPLILLEARHIYWPCCSYVTFVRINRWPVPHSNGIRPSVKICAHLHTRDRTEKFAD